MTRIVIPPQERETKLDSLKGRRLRDYTDHKPHEKTAKTDQLENLSEQEKEWARIARRRFPTQAMEDYESWLRDVADRFWKPTETFIKETLRPNWASLRDAPQDRINEQMEALSDEFQKELDQVNANRRIQQFGRQIKTKAIMDFTAELERGQVSAFTPYSGKINQYVDASIAENVKLVKSIPGQYHDDLQRVISEGIRNNWTIDEMTRVINERFEVAAGRAKTIAMDQTNSLYSAITRAQHAEIGLKKFRWVAVMDSRTRESHVELHGSIHSWENGASGVYPGGPINCRCIAIAVRDDLVEIARNQQGAIA